MSGDPGTAIIDAQGDPYVGNNVDTVTNLITEKFNDAWAYAQSAESAAMAFISSMQSFTMPALSCTIPTTDINPIQDINMPEPSIAMPTLTYNDLTPPPMPSFSSLPSISVDIPSGDPTVPEFNMPGMPAFSNATIPQSPQVSQIMMPSIPNVS